MTTATAGQEPELLTIYDAEDEPHPAQLKEAAARFCASPKVGCLQAPLRIRPRQATGFSSTFLDRQFAFEYAALFEVYLPGLARLGLPFPLGGTSNHIRVTALLRAGGWDPYNVTEDADLGFRLWADRWKLGVINAPTFETPPGPLDRWLPQRTRWLKGYMQTWGVHTRRPGTMDQRGLAALTMTLGAAIMSAAFYAPAVAWIGSAIMIGLTSGLEGTVSLRAALVLLLGSAAACAGCAVGARKAGIKYGFLDILAAPAYWSLLSMAFAHALWRLVIQPHVWDKTPHDALVEAVETGRKAA